MSWNRVNMLEPQSRRHLMEALRPPVGYELDRAIGTTFSLDLLALLTAPLSFTIFGWEEEDGSPTADPLALFEGLRRYSDRISIFCQAGQIAVPTSSPLLLGYLEDSVIEVTPPTPGRIFHPKVWALRLTSADGPAMYRLLVLSRNLSFDRSWDTVLVLEGEVSGRKRGSTVNRPLGEFFTALPGLAVREVPEHAREAVELIQEEIRRTDFELPLGFNNVRFWPLGLSGRRQWPFGERVGRLLCISPFATKGLLDRLPGRAGGVLVSRHEELDALDPKTLEAFGQSYVLRQEAELEDELPEEATEEASGDGSGRPTSEDHEGETLSGLHAKLYVVDAGWNARIWTGSANATHAAFSGNIEFLVELAGKKSFCGIDRVLGISDDSTGFKDLLQRYEPTTEPAERDQTRARLENRADDVRRDLVGSSLRASITTSEDAADRFTVVLHMEKNVSAPEDVSVRCWPITLRHEQAARVFDLSSASVAQFELSLEAITPFFAFEVTATEGEARFSRRFVLNVPLSGAPENRREAMVNALLSDRGRVMRLILMLLAEGSPDERQISLVLGRSCTGETSSSGTGGVPNIPLFEEIVRALWNNPRALDRIESMLARLRRSERGTELIPEGLEEIWPQVMEARGATSGEDA
jgi:hypothetical protein